MAENLKCRGQEYINKHRHLDKSLFRVRESHDAKTWCIKVASKENTDQSWVFLKLMKGQPVITILWTQKNHHFRASFKLQVYGSFGLCHFPSQNSYVFVLPVTLKLFSKNSKARTIPPPYTHSFQFTLIVCWPPVIASLNGFKSMLRIRFPPVTHPWRFWFCQSGHHQKVYQQ